MDNNEATEHVTENSLEAYMQAFIFGHSHMWAIRQALAQSQKQGRHTDKHLVLCGTAEFPGSLVYANYQSGRLSLNASLLSALQRAGAAAETDILVSGVQGNQYNAIALLTDGAPFDFHIPEWPRLPSAEAALLPLGAVKEMIAAQLQEFQLFCSRLPSLSYRGFIHLAPPPPIPDNEFIRSKLPPLPSGESQEVSAPDLRLKLWTIQQQMCRKMVEGSGGHFLMPPSGTQDPDGFLARKFWKDSVHANGAYAELQLEQVDLIMHNILAEKE